MKQITQAVLTALLQEVKGAKMTTLTIETPVDMRKTNNPFYGKVTKRYEVNVVINFNYSNSLNKALTKKVGRVVTATVNKRTWGERIGTSCFVIHKGHMYLEGKLNAKPKKISYLMAGEELNKGQVKLMSQFLRAKKEQIVPMIDVNINNVKEIKIDKQHYQVNG